jgi:predicted TIM-barrel fold metal-dependent hydrolase
MKSIAACLVTLLWASQVLAQERLPIIDMHLHAHAADHQGTPPRGICAPFTQFPAWDPARSWGDVFAEMQRDPPCDDPLWSPTSDEALRDRTLEILERRNIIGMLSGSPDRVEQWRETAPERIIPGLELFGRNVDVSPESLRQLYQAGRVAVLSEVSNQYAGIPPNDPRLEPYWAVAEELDMPVGIHIHPGPPGTPYLGGPTHGLHSPLLLEEVLVRHPGLRVYVIHAAWPQLDDMLTLLFTHPQVYVDVGGLVWIHPRADFYRYLRAIVEAGFGNRVMFGSDQMIWPEAIERAIQSIEDAPFLSEQQKRDILYNNAARFFRLSEEDIARHHAM